MKVKKTNPILEFKEKNKLTWLKMSHIADLTPNTLHLLSRKSPIQLLKTTPLETYLKLKKAGVDLLEEMGEETDSPFYTDNK